jgi:serine/threonine protein kinase
MTNNPGDDATILPGTGTRIRPGDRFRDWEVESFLGAGSFGTVWRAHRNRLGGQQVAALKVLDRLLVADAREQLVREFTLLSSIEHPNMLRYLDAFEMEEGRHAGFVVFVLELADTDMKNAIALSVSGLPEKDMCAVFADLADGVAAFHQQGQAHGDIKPANILRVGSVWKLADFGIAAPLDGSYSLVGGTTLDYCPPEELTGAIDAPADSANGARRLHRSADVWALGIALFEAVTKRHPYVGDSPRSRMASIMSDRRDFTGISPDLAELLDKHCLAVDHHNRIAPDELARRLRLLPTPKPIPASDTRASDTRVFATSEPDVKAPLSTEPVRSKPAARSPRIIIAVAAVLLALAGVTGFLLTRGGDKPSPANDPSLSSLSIDTTVLPSSEATDTEPATFTDTAPAETTPAETSIGVSATEPVPSDISEITGLPPLP